MTEFNESVSAALNPEGVEHVFVLYETLGWPLAGAVALPLLGILIHGFVLGEQRRENFWLMVITGFVLGILSVMGLPLVLHIL